MFIRRSVLVKNSRLDNLFSWCNRVSREKKIIIDSQNTPTGLDETPIDFPGKQAEMIYNDQLTNTTKIRY